MLQKNSNKKLSKLIKTKPCSPSQSSCDYTYLIYGKLCDNCPSIANTVEFKYNKRDKFLSIRRPKTPPSA